MAEEFAEEKREFLIPCIEFLCGRIPEVEVVGRVAVEAASPANKAADAVAFGAMDMLKFSRTTMKTTQKKKDYKRKREKPQRRKKRIRNQR